MNPLDTTFSALSDPIRRSMLAQLSLGEACVNDFVDRFGLSQPAITKHVQALERAGLVTRRQDRQRRPIRLRGEGIRDAAQWLDFYKKFWDESFDRLEAHLQSNEKEKETPK
jgi:DNA-binding transcriptional ArsR family regulator